MKYKFVNDKYKAHILCENIIYRTGRRFLYDEKLKLFASEKLNPKMILGHAIIKLST